MSQQATERLTRIWGCIAILQSKNSSRPDLRAPEQKEEPQEEAVIEVEISTSRNAYTYMG
jgi:hypothetical protein